jgi:hypothetical protein
MDILRGQEKVPHQFGDAELKQAAKLIAFDMYHFRCYIHQGVAYQGLYSMLLYLHLLVDFFYREPIHDDCCVTHFNRCSGFAALFPPELYRRTSQIDELRRHLHKLVAHFTSVR